MLYGSESSISIEHLKSPNDSAGWWGCLLANLLILVGETRGLAHISVAVTNGAHVTLIFLLNQKSMCYNSVSAVICTRQQVLFPSWKACRRYAWRRLPSIRTLCDTLAQIQPFFVIIFAPPQKPCQTFPPPQTDIFAFHMSIIGNINVTDARICEVGTTFSTFPKWGNHRNEYCTSRACVSARHTSSRNVMEEKPCVSNDPSDMHILHPLLCWK
jgi:hypothetical protein